MVGVPDAFCQALAKPADTNNKTVTTAKASDDSKRAIFFIFSLAFTEWLLSNSSRQYSVVEDPPKCCTYQKPVCLD